MFRDYVVLHIRFTTIMYLESIGVEKECYTERIEGKYQDTSIKASQVAGYRVDILQSAIDIRDEKNESQGNSAMRKVLDYIDENYYKETISLNEVADAVNMSANYLSAIFSQNMQKTFVEYITCKRVDRSRRDGQVVAQEIYDLISVMCLRKNPVAAQGNIGVRGLHDIQN